MQNEAGETVELYMPRKCSATNTVIGAKDHASVQLNVALVDGEGRSTGESKTYALCGAIRSMGEADDAINRLTQDDGILHKVFDASFKK
eukprot:m.9390 g.9390  ORF g.9390 m.9390 type:complete len:89 (-) comp6899_c0_seq1:81-347(-)